MSVKDQLSTKRLNIEKSSDSSRSVYSHTTLQSSYHYQINPLKNNTRNINTRDKILIFLLPMRTTGLNGEKSSDIPSIYKWTATPHSSSNHIIRFIQKEGATQRIQILLTNHFKRTTQEEALSINRLYGEKASDSPSKYRV